jgi:ankyrin repeat protein
MIHLLIAHGADIEARDRTPLILSSRNSLSMAALLEHGADAGVHNIYGLTPLHGVCGWLDSQHQELAQSHGAIVNATDETGKTPPALDIRWGEALSWRNFYWRMGADVNAISNSGLSPPHYAVFHQSGAALVALLLEHGANVNATDGTGDTPLQLLARYGAHDTTDVIALLLDYGADVSVLDIGEVSIARTHECSRRRIDE